MVYANDLEEGQEKMWPRSDQSRKEEAPTGQMVRERNLEGTCPNQSGF